MRGLHLPSSVRVGPGAIPSLARGANMRTSSILLGVWEVKRGVASQVSGKPGSQTFEHAATNVKEELGNSAAELAKSIAGANNPVDSVVDHAGLSFVSISLLPCSPDDVGC